MVCPMELVIYGWTSFIQCHEPNTTRKHTLTYQPGIEPGSRVECATLPVVSPLDLSRNTLKVIPGKEYVSLHTRAP